MDMLFMLPVLLAGCGVEAGPTHAASPTQMGLPTITLERVQAYGAADLPQGDTSAAGGALLAQIASIRDDADGLVYVLDAGFRKIAVFGPDGELRQVVMGGYGEGPGEFMHPTALALKDDEIGVFDYRLNRVSLFNRRGELVETHRTPRAKDIALVSNKVVGTHMPGRKSALWVLDRESGDVRSALPLGGNGLAYNPLGVTAHLGHGPDGSLRVYDERPGLWYDWRRLAEPHDWQLFRGRRHTVDQRGLPVPPALTLGGGGLADGRSLIAYREMDQQAETARSKGNYLMMFSRDGNPIALTALPDAWSAMAVSADGETILIAEYEPWPQVVRYRIAVSGNSG
jgi:hypothetical protein